MNIIDETNQEVLKLWEATFRNGDDIRMPQIYPPMKQNALLFIGSNPSFSESSFRIILKDTPYSSIDPEKFFHWSNRANFDMKIAKDIELLARKKHPYFAKFKEIANYVEISWEHIDLFFYRETNQKRLEKKVYPRKKLTDFGRKQLELSERLIVQAKPKIIVVANAFASQLYQSELFSSEVKDDFSDEYGYHMLRFNKRAIPVFLASMFTGQRAMDNGSYQRLKWHIKNSVVNP